jgi:hypothetical protein
MITWEHLLLRTRIVNALESLDTRDFWIEVRLEGNRDYDSFRPEEFKAAAGKLLESLDRGWRDEPLEHRIRATESVTVA